MTMIHVPRPPKSSLNLNRPVSSLVLNQVEHMHIAEKRLPLRYRTAIYVNAIKTEGEAASYISEVTTAIHRAHKDAARRRARRAPSRTATLQIVAAAEKKTSAKRTGKVAAKKAVKKAVKKAPTKDKKAGRRVQAKK
jgi:hypothetical protein